MTEEPYRWLEAISNRREYVRDQLKEATPVFACSRPEGILLLGVGHGQSKVFEIYDRHAYAALGHPVDIEKVRQSAIESAHLEGFNRSAKDVTLRRLISFALSPALKTSFEQIFSPPIMVEAVFAELGETPEQDVLVRLHFDGNHHYAKKGLAVAHRDYSREKEAADWLDEHLKNDAPLGCVARLCLVAWEALIHETPFAELAVPSDKTKAALPDLEGRVLELALLDRRTARTAKYQPLIFEQLES